ncbi:MAG: hypothetical protein RI967_199 [Planctomycetota bacterium]
MAHLFTNRLRLLLALVLLACVSVRAHAQSVRIEAASTEAYVGEPLRLTVTIRNSDGYEGPVIPSVDGVEIRRLPGEETSSMTRIVNGRRSTETTVGIRFEAIPARTGDFTIPPFVVVIGGREFRTEPVRFTATVSETGNLLRVRVTGSPERPFVGQRGTIDLEIAIRTYRDAKLGIELDEGAMWSLVDGRSSDWGIWFPALQQLEAERRRPRGLTRTIDGEEYLVYTISKEFDPIAAGTPGIGEVRVRMNYPTALRRGNDLFFENRLTLAASRPISAAPDAIEVEAQSPPVEGRPPSWNGAVGAFEIVAVARPTEVAVGDPITLSIRIADRSGEAGLEGVLAPPFAEQLEFARSFRVPRDAPSGTVEGDAKVFTQTVRALDDGVREIPPIEFAFFNPATESYEVVRSRPIPISVKPSPIARLEVEPPAAAPPEKRDERDATAPREGPRPIVPLLGPDGQPDRGLLARNLGEIGPVELGLFALPPLAAAAVVVVARRRAADARNPAARRARLARRTCEARLATARDASALGDALLGFVADREGMAEGAATRGDAVDLLRRRGVDAAVVAELDGFLRACERARFAADTTVAADPATARALLARLETPRATAIARAEGAK